MTLTSHFLRQAAAVQTIVVALDFDGTIAPLAEHPSMAVADPAALQAISRLARRPRTRLAVISGRGLADLRARLPSLDSSITLVGSHGAEWSPGSISGLGSAALTGVPEVIARLREVAERCPGAWVEAKPAGAALHVRHADPRRAPGTIEEARQRLSALPGVLLRRGVAALDASVSRANKGGAIAAIAQDAGADATIFFGDDATDEEAFLTLEPPSVGVKVGPGPTYASARVEGVAEVVAALELLDSWRAALPRLAPTVLG